MRDQTVIAQLMGQIEEDLSEAHFIFDDQNAAPLKRCLVTIIGKHGYRCFHRHRGRGRLLDDRRGRNRQ